MMFENLLLFIELRPFSLMDLNNPVSVSNAIERPIPIKRPSIGAKKIKILDSKEAKIVFILFH